MDTKGLLGSKEFADIEDCFESFCQRLKFRFQNVFQILLPSPIFPKLTLVLNNMGELIKLRNNEAAGLLAYFAMMDQANLFQDLRIVCQVCCSLL